MATSPRDSQISTLPATVFPRHVVNLHDREVAFVDVGDGPPLVLLHGITCSAASWNDVMPRLAERYRIIVPDLPGHGRSHRARGDYSIAGFALSVRDLLMGLGVHKATFIGHSLGGGVTMQTAYAYPELVGRMILVASGGLGQDVGIALRMAALPGVEWLMPLAFNRVGARVTAALGDQIHDPRMATLRELSHSYAMLADPTARKAFVSLLRGVIDFAGQRINATNRLHLAQEVPLMVIWGERDLIIPLHHGQEAARTQPVDRFEVFTGAGHFPHLEQPEHFCDVVDDFIATHPSADNSHRLLAQRIRESLRASDPTIRTPSPPPATLLDPPPLLPSGGWKRPGWYPQ